MDFSTRCWKIHAKIVVRRVVDPTRRPCIPRTSRRQQQLQDLTRLLARPCPTTSRLVFVRFYVQGEARTTGISRALGLLESKGLDSVAVFDWCSALSCCCFNKLFSTNQKEERPTRVVD